MVDSANVLKLVAWTLFLTMLAVALVASLVLATDVYLLVFLAILTSVLFVNLAEWFGRFTGLPYGANLGIAVTTTLLIAVTTIAFFGVRIEQQIQETTDEVDQSFAQLNQWLEEHPPVQATIGKLPLVGDLFATGRLDASQNEAASDSSISQEDHASGTPGEQGQARDAAAEELTATGWSSVGSVGSMSGRIMGVVGKLFSTTFGVAMNVAFVLFVGVFLAIKPGFYRDHVALLFPPKRRERVREILNDIGDTLFQWLQGRAATMVITGVGTGLVLAVLGVPLAFTLGVITGVLTFIPNIGGMLALMLSMLVAFSHGSSTVMWVVVAYAALQFVESNIVTPLIQQHQTSVPPPLLLTSQLMMGVLTGFLGVLVATPLIAAVIVLVREAYVKDVLGEETVSLSHANSIAA